MVAFSFAFLLNSLAMSVIILVVLAVGVLFPRVFPAKVRYTVWLVVLVGLIIPLRPMIGGGLIGVPLPNQDYFPASVALTGEQVEITPIPELSTGQALVLPPDSGAVDYAAAASNSEDLILILVLVWVAVAAGMFAYHIFRYIRFIRTIRRWGEPEVDGQCLSILRSVQAEMGLEGKKIDLKVCTFVSSSMLTGFFGPVILLPEKNFQSDELELIFRHELVHFRRRDMLVKLLSVIAVSMHWFNPIVYRMSAAMQEDGEASCDQAVLSNSRTELRHFYAEVIIGMIGGKNRVGTLLSTSFYGGKNGIKKRLNSIMDTTGNAKSAAFALLAVVATLTIFSGSVFALAMPQDYLHQPSGAVAAGGSIGIPRARDIALAIVGGGEVLGVHAGYRDGVMLYEIEISYGSDFYAVTLVASDGSLVGLRSNQPLGHFMSQGISLEQAREIAVAAVGGGVVQGIEAGYESGVMQIGIIVRYSEGLLYYITLDASSGGIVGMYALRQDGGDSPAVPGDYFAPPETPPPSAQNQPPIQALPEATQPTQPASSPSPSPQEPTGGAGFSGTTIPLEQAIQIANNDLAARGISATFRAHSGIDWEYGQWVWELEFMSSMGVIEYYINASTGAIVKFEIDGW